MRYIKNGTLKSILLIIIGATILSFGSYNFNYQNNVTEGGVLGLLLLLQHVFNISPSITSVVIDFSLFTIGSKFFGKKFLLYSILCNKLLKLKVNHVYLATDAIVLLMSLVYLDIKQVFFSIIAVTISGKIISIIYKDDEDNKDNIEEIDDEIIYE